MISLHNPLSHVACKSMCLSGPALMKFYMFIFKTSCYRVQKQSISKEIINAEHEHMNMPSPSNYCSSYATANYELTK